MKTTIYVNWDAKEIYSADEFKIWKANKVQERTADYDNWSDFCDDQLDYCKLLDAVKTNDSNFLSHLKTQYEDFCEAEVEDDISNQWYDIEERELEL